MGSFFGSTGPLSLNAETGRPFGGDFPDITISDMTASQKLLIDRLGIGRFHTVIGGSMGAMLSLDWAINYPDSLDNLVLISSSYKAYPANIANRSIQHQAIRMDAMWNGGNYASSRDLTGFRLARKLGLYTYRNAAENSASTVTTALTPMIPILSNIWTTTRRNFAARSMPTATWS